MGEFLYFVLALTLIYVVVTLFGIFMLLLWIRGKVHFLFAVFAAGLFNWIMYWETSWIRAEAYGSMTRMWYSLMLTSSFVLWLLGIVLIFIVYSKFQKSRIKTGWEAWRASH